MKDLKYGEESLEIRALQSEFVQQGFLRKHTSGSFLKPTVLAVKSFQLLHQDHNGKQLISDGIVGEKTWKAIKNPYGNFQRSFIKLQIPEGISQARFKTLETAEKEYYSQATELTQSYDKREFNLLYDSTGFGQWDCFFWSGCTVPITGRYPLHAKFGSSKSAWFKAKALKIATTKEEYIPMPGDAFVTGFLNKDRLIGGHIGFVVRVERDPINGIRFNTIEGCFGNRIKVGLRSMNDENLIGFINHYKDGQQDSMTEQGVFEKGSADK
jgi:hypothetical protein